MWSWVKGLETLAPIIIPIVYPPAAVVVPFIIHGIKVAEDMKGATNAEKLAHATDLVNTGIVTANQLGAKINADEVNGVMSQSISLGVTLANIFKNNTATLGTPPSN